MMRILSAVWSAIVAVVVFAVDAIRTFFVWLRKPGSKLKALCAILATVSAWAGIAAFQAEQQIVLITKQCETDKGGLRDTIKNKDEALAEITARLTIEAFKMRMLQAANKPLLAENNKKAEAAKVSATAFKNEFNKKPPSCTAALEAMEAACPTLREY